MAEVENLNEKCNELFEYKEQWNSIKSDKLLLSAKVSQL